MHSIFLGLSYWCSVTTFVFGLAFILFLEIHNRSTGFIATMETPGWRGIIPSMMFVGSILSAMTSAGATLLLTWF